MKIKKAMILAAGKGTRMQPLTLKNPKPLIKIGKYSLLEKGINLLIDHGIEEIVINVHYLSHQIEDFILSKNYKIKIIISNEIEALLDTGGGAFKGTEVFNDEPFIILNPDTLWNKNYLSELKLLEEMYFKTKKTCLLLVNKTLSFDPTFIGDFNLKSDKYVFRDKDNQYIYTGLQVLDRSAFDFIEKKIFSMNLVWDRLILSNNLYGLKSKEKFYHLNTKSIYDKISKLNFID